MASDEPCVVLALEDDDREIVVKALAAAGFEGTTVTASTRAELAEAVGAHQPALVALELAATHAAGGGAVADVIRAESPHTRVLFVGDAGERSFVEGVSAGDAYCARPLQPALVEHAVRTLLVQWRLLLTGRYQRARRFNPQATEAAAIRTVALKLAAAASIGQVAEVLKGALAEIADFDAFALCEAPLPGQRLSPRVYLQRRIPRAVAGRMLDGVNRELSNQFGAAAAEQATVQLFGAISGDADGRGASADAPAATLAFNLETPQGVAGVVVLARGEAFALPHTVELFVRALLTQAAAALPRLMHTHAERLETLRIMLDSMADGCVWIDDRRRHTVANRAARALLGLRSGPVGREQIDAALRKFGAKADLLGTGNIDRSLVLTQVEIPAEAVRAALRMNEEPDGVTTGRAVMRVPVELTRVRDDRRLNVGGLLVLRLRGVNRVDREDVDEALNSLAHEVKGPLNTLRGYSELLIDGAEGELAPGQLDCIERMHKEVARISNLVSVFLDSDNRLFRRLRKAPLPAREFLESLADDHQDELQRRGVKLEVRVDEAATTLLGDAEHLRIALNNLVVNALRYSPQGGTIELAAAPYDAAQHRGRDPSLSSFRRRPPGGVDRSFVMVHCADQGPGVRPSHTERVFERFVTDRDTEDDGTDMAGSGLGLSIARSIVHAHGGVIWVEPANPESREQPGARFCMTLPVSFTVLGEQALHAPAPPARPSPADS